MAQRTGEAGVRVTLQGPSGRHDLVVSSSAPAADLVVPVVAALLGELTQSAPAVLTRSGSVLDPRRSIADQGVRDGDLLVVVPTRTRSRTRTRRASSPVPVRVPGTAGAWRFWALGAACLVVSLLGFSLEADADRRWWVLLLVAGCALGSVLAPANPRGDAARVVLPLAGGLGLLLVLDGPGAGERLIALVAACVVTAVLVSAARATDRGPDEPLLVLLVVSVSTGLLLMAVVLAGAGESVVWALLVGLVLPVVRLLPAAVIDVPDTVLLELDRLSVTAWSAHEQGRGRVRTRLRASDVAPTVGRGRWLHASAVTGACLVAVAGSLLLLVSPADGLAGTGRAVLVPVTALGTALLSRTVRGRVPKVSLLLAAGACAAAAAWTALRSPSLPDGLGGVALAGGVAVAGLLVALVAAALGAGWRSVRWGRFADGVETLCVAVALPAALVAAGAVEWLRQLVV